MAEKKLPKPVKMSFETFKPILVAIIKKAGKVVPPDGELFRAYHLYQKGIKPKAPSSLKPKPRSYIRVHTEGKPTVTKFLPDFQSIDEKVEIARKKKRQGRKQ